MSVKFCFALGAFSICLCGISFEVFFLFLKKHLPASCYAAVNVFEFFMYTGY